jgi:hypothetical protein
MYAIDSIAIHSVVIIIVQCPKKWAMVFATVPDQHETNYVSPVSTKSQPDIQSLASPALLPNQSLVPYQCFEINDCIRNSSMVCTKNTNYYKGQSQPFGARKHRRGWYHARSCPIRSRSGRGCYRLTWEIKGAKRFNATTFLSWHLGYHGHS